MGRRVTAEVEETAGRDIRSCLQVVLRLRAGKRGTSLYDTHTEIVREHPDLESIDQWELAIDQIGLTAEYKRLLKKSVRPS